MVFAWLNPLLLRGSRQVLTAGKLLPLEDAIRAKTLQENFKVFWGNRKCSETSSFLHSGDNFLAGNQQNQYSLLLTLVSALKWQIAAAVTSRLCLVAFTLCQPLFINRVVNFVLEPESEETKAIGIGLIGAAALIYIGIAVGYCPEHLFC